MVWGFGEMICLSLDSLVGYLTDHESKGVPSVDSDTPTVSHSQWYCVPRKVIHRLVDQGKYHQCYQYTVADSIEIGFLFS